MGYGVLLILFFSIFIVSLLFIKSNHLLSIMIMLEFAFLLVFQITTLLWFETQELINFTLFLAIAACESAIALSTYVLMTRYYSKDYVINFYSMKM